MCFIRSKTFRSHTFISSIANTNAHTIVGVAKKKQIIVKEGVNAHCMCVRHASNFCKRLYSTILARIDRIYYDYDIMCHGANAKNQPNAIGAYVWRV